MNQLVEPTVNILSPDGITIRLENFYTQRQAKQYFKVWMEQFKSQGYYSSNFGRIPLDHVWDYCKYIPDEEE